ncbi:hypothetical protein ACS0TY_015748 [Phlomoides rotata]
MENSIKTGFVTVFAVSGSVVFLAMKAHNRLLSDFIKKMEFEFKTSTGVLKVEPKKKVRFAADVAESTAKKGHSKNYDPAKLAAGACRNNGEKFEGIPQNWQVLYKGILQHRRECASNIETDEKGKCASIHEIDLYGIGEQQSLRTCITSC